MHILLMNDKYRQPGATSAIVENLRVEYERNGHAVSILTTHRTEQNPAIVRKGYLTSIPVSYRPSLRHYLCLYRPGVTKMLEEIIPALKPDVVHAHNVHTYPTYDSLPIAAQATPPVVVTAHDVMSFAYRRLATARFLDSKGTDARLSPLDHFRAAGLQYNPVRNAWIRRILRTHVKRVLPVSRSLEHALRQHGIAHTTVVPNAIDTTHTQPDPSAVAELRKEYGLDGRKVILFGGRLSADKGVAEILRAMRFVKEKHKEAILLVTGDNEKWKEMTDAYDATESLKEHVRCTGWLAPERMRIAFAAADVVTTPSLCLDTFNMMNIEAMVAGKPVVGTIFGGTPEIVEDGRTGFTLDPRDTKAYAARLITLLDDRALAEKMGAAGREKVLSHYGLETQSANYLALFEEAVRS